MSDILDRNPQFAEAYAIEELKALGGDAIQISEWHRIRELGLAWKEADTQWRASCRNRPTDKTSVEWFLADQASTKLWCIRDSARDSYNAACDAYFLGDVK